MAIEKAIKFAGIDIPQAYHRGVWINLNGHGGQFSAEVTMQTHKDAAARAGEKKIVTDEEGRNSEVTVPVAPILTENIVLADTPENKADIDRIRAIVYGMLSREEKYSGGRAV